jgi:hypothetical protein
LPCTDGSCKDVCGSCGNGVIDQNSGELCDGSDRNGLSCYDLGFDGGSLGCNAVCGFDTSQCVGTPGICGDGALNVGENCDGLNMSVTGCSNLGFSAGGVLSCNTDCSFNVDGCYDTPACQNNSDCPPGAVCGVDGTCGCPDGTDLCSDGTCSSDCDYKDCIGSPDGVCSFGEGCHCADCEGQQASCDFVSSCVSNFCTECTLTQALWNMTSCYINVCVAKEFSPVELLASGSSGCDGKVFNFGVYSENNPNDLVASPPTGIFVDRSVTSNWEPSVILGEQVSSYYFVVSLFGTEVSSSNSLKVCRDDADCDGVMDDNDECNEPPMGEPVDSGGCTSAQRDCINNIDCTSIAWTECNENNTKTRQICVDPNGNPNTCCNSQDTCKCVIGALPSYCGDVSNMIPTVRECVVEAEFPFFSAVNVLMVVSLLVAFYVFRFRRR